MHETHAENTEIKRAVAEFRGGVDVEPNFRRIFDFYYRPVNAFFRRRTFSPEEADELTQETFLRVYNKIEQFRGEAPFEAWLWQIAANLFRKSVARRHTQKRAGETVSLEGDDENSSPDVYLQDKNVASPLDGILEAEERREMRTAIEDLPEQMRKCIKLRVFQDLSYKEIAVVMRLSPQTVKTHLFQARRHLRERLGAYFSRVDV